jgi:WD40 repeat protein
MVSLNNYSLAVSCLKAVIFIWDIKNKTLINQLTGHKLLVRALVRIKTELLASGSKDMSIKIWNFTNCKLLKNLTDNIGTCCENPARSREYSLVCHIVDK